MVKLRGKQADKMANGLILVIFGFLLLLIQLRISDHWFWLTYMNTPITFFFIAGAISLWLKREKNFGYILIGIGIIGYSDIAWGWSKEFTQYLLPTIVTLAGIGLMFFAKTK